MKMKLFNFFKRSDTMEKETYLIVGLGNPGTTYAHTRHNVGFDVTDTLCARWGVQLNRARFKGMLCETVRDGVRVVIVQPQTYMNASGECIAELLSWYKCPLDHLLVIYDDIDLPASRLRMRKNGSAGTHNGMRSILQHTPSQDFPRLRVGVGSCPENWQLVDWVLSRYLNADEQSAMNNAFAKCCDVIEDWLSQGIDHAMQVANRK